MDEGMGRGFRATSEQWPALLEEYSASGKSIRGYCQENGIPVSQMHYHLRRAREAETKHGFIELELEGPGKLWIEAGNCRIRVERGFDAVLLRQVAEALI